MYIIRDSWRHLPLPDDEHRDDLRAHNDGQAVAMRNTSEAKAVCWPQETMDRGLEGLTSGANPFEALRREQRAQDQQPAVYSATIKLPGTEFALSILREARSTALFPSANTSADAVRRPVLVPQPPRLRSMHDGTDDRGVSSPPDRSPSAQWNASLCNRQRAAATPLQQKAREVSLTAA